MHEYSSQPMHSMKLPSMCSSLCYSLPVHNTAHITPSHWPEQPGRIVACLTDTAASRTLVCNTTCISHPELVIKPGDDCRIFYAFPLATACTADEVRLIQIAVNYSPAPTRRAPTASSGRVVCRCLQVLSAGDLPLQLVNILDQFLTAALWA